MLRIEVFQDSKDSLGEGPIWSVKDNRLYWIDIYGPRVLSCDAAGGDLRCWDLPEPVGAIALRAQGGAVAALASGFYLLDFATGKLECVAKTQASELRVRMNDGKVDRRGRFIVGSMDGEEQEGLGKIFCLDADLTVRELDSGFVVSNGPCWSPDNKTFYLADSFKKAIYAYDYDIDTGSVRSRRLFVSCADFQGFPDGATVDEEGYIWVVEVYCGRLVRFDPNGVIDRVVGLPVKATTSISFGGDNLDIAYITSMARPIAGQYPHEKEAGAVFAIHGLGVRGLPEPYFAG